MNPSPDSSSRGTPVRPAPRRSPALAALLLFSGFAVAVLAQRSPGKGCVPCGFPGPAVCRMPDAAAGGARLDDLAGGALERAAGAKTSNGSDQP